MPAITLEGVVEHGQLTLTTPVPLPDQTKVSVVISDPRSEPRARLISPRLAHQFSRTFDFCVLTSPYFT